MTIEYTPVDIACNLKCSYCYQEPMRDAGNVSNPKDWERAKEELLRQGHAFALFGGEPLLAPIEHIEEVLRFGYENFGSNSIQTNGTLITDAHIDLFKKYKVGVGISCDGPGSLSDLRRGSTCDETRLATDRTNDAIVRLCQAGLYPSAIVTVHKMNASSSVRPELIRWLSWLESYGVRHVNLHMLEIEPGMEDVALSEEENTQAFLEFYQFSKISRMGFSPFQDIRNLLTGEGQADCIWNACDPLTTPAVQGVARDGSRRNCGRVNKDGVNWLKADSHGRERYIALYHTPQEHGGCKGCRFFAFCKGNCPGTAIDGDWRNRSIHCATWKGLISAIEKDVENPISLELGIVHRLEAAILSPLAHGNSPHGDVHGDSPHGDAHGDSDLRGVSVTWLSG